MDAGWLLWLALALIAGVAELLTLSLVFGMVAGGAVAAAAVAAVTGNAVASVLAFAVSTGMLLALVRPPLLRYSERMAPGAVTGVAALVGRQAVVVEPVTASAGEVRLGGEIWTARAEAPGAVLETGSRVVVTRIEGATARVRAAVDSGAVGSGAVGSGAAGVLGPGPAHPAPAPAPGEVPLTGAAPQPGPRLPGPAPRGNDLAAGPGGEKHTERPES